MYNVSKLVEEFTTSSQEPLNENWFERWFKGHDKDSIDEITDKMKNKIHTESDKKRAINEIDDLIDNSNREFTPSSAENYLADVGATMIFAPIMLAKFITRISEKSKRSAYKEALLKIRTQVQAIKVKE